MCWYKTQQNRSGGVKQLAYNGSGPCNDQRESSNMSYLYWMDVVVMMVYLMNQCLTIIVHDVSQHEWYYGRRPINMFYYKFLNVPRMCLRWGMDKDWTQFKEMHFSLATWWNKIDQHGYLNSSYKLRCHFSFTFGHATSRHHNNV